MSSGYCGDPERSPRMRGAGPWDAWKSGGTTNSVDGGSARMMLFH